MIILGDDHPMTTPASTAEPSKSLRDDEEIVRTFLHYADLNPNRQQPASAAFSRLTATVARLEADNERLRSALEPFAKSGSLFEIPRQTEFDSVIYAPAAGENYYLTGDHLRAARAALARNEEKGNG